MKNINWEQVQDSISKGIKVYYINECIQIDRLSCNDDYVLIGRAGIKTFKDGFLSDYKTSKMFFIK